jgi:hypothetical protein
MPAKAAVVLAVPLVFAATVAFADTSNRAGYRSPFVAEAMSQSSADRIAAVRDAVNGNESLAASQSALFKSAFFCRGGLDLTTVWIIDGPRRQRDSRQPRAHHVRQIHHAGSWSQGPARFREREISGRAGRYRGGHAVDLRRLRRPREG